MGLGAQYPGAVGGRRAGGHQLDRLPELVQRVLREAAENQEATDALVEACGQRRVLVGVDQRERATPECDSAPAVAREQRRLRRPPQQLNTARARLTQLFGHGVPQLGRALEVHVGLGECRHPLGLGSRLRGGRERGGQVVRRRPVDRQLRGNPAARHRQRRIFAERAAERGVNRAALPRQQVVGDRLAQERVPEPVRVAAGLLNEHVVRDSLANAGEQRVGVERRGRHQQPVANARTRRSCDPQHGLRIGAQQLDPQHQRLADVVGQAAVAVAAAGGEQLLGEERVALRPNVEVVDQPRRRRMAEDAGELIGQLVASEPLEREAGRARAVGLGQERPQRVSTVELVGPVGDDRPSTVRGGDCGSGS